MGMGSKEGVERARQAMRLVFDDVEARLAGAPPKAYLSGDTFGAYDLSFCTMAAFAVLPPEATSCVKAAREFAAGTLPQDGVHLQFMKEFRDRPAGQHVLKCYQKHRA